MRPTEAPLLVLLGACAAWIVATAHVSAAVAQNASARRCPRPEARAAAPSSLPSGVPLAGFDGRDFFVLGAGGFLARVDACSGRWRILRSPVADVADARVVQTGDGALVLAPAGVFAIRRGAARRLPDLAPTVMAPVAVGGPEVAVLVGDRVAVIDLRSRRVRRSTAAPQAMAPTTTALAVDSEQISVVVPGVRAMFFDRQSGAWSELPVPPSADDARLARVARSLVLLGTIDRAHNMLGAFELAPGAREWQPRELASTGARGRIVASSAEGDRLVVWIANGSTRSRVAYAPATHAWSTLDGLAIGGREVADGRVVVGTQSPVAAGPGRYAIASMPADAAPARWAIVPAAVGALAETTTNDYGTLVFASGAGRVLAVRAPSETPTGWHDDPSSCTGPREPGAPGCDPVSVPTGVAHTPGESFVFAAP